MSVSSYFGKAGRKLRLKIGDKGSLSVDDALAVEARRAWRLGETYESVAHYDPVLRSHCRLDQKLDEKGDEQ